MVSRRPMVPWLQLVQVEVSLNGPPRRPLHLLRQVLNLPRPRARGTQDQGMVQLSGERAEKAAWVEPLSGVSPSMSSQGEGRTAVAERGDNNAGGTSSQSPPTPPTPPPPPPTPPTPPPLQPQATRKVPPVAASTAPIVVPDDEDLIDDVEFTNSHISAPGSASEDRQALAYPSDHCYLWGVSCVHASQSFGDLRDNITLIMNQGLQDESPCLLLTKSATKNWSGKPLALVKFEKEKAQ